MLAEIITASDMIFYSLQALWSLLLIVLKGLFTAPVSYITILSIIGILLGRKARRH